MHPEILDKRIISVHYSGQVGRPRKNKSGEIRAWDGMFLRQRGEGEALSQTMISTFL
jgi:hypothetical protein